MDIEYNIIKIFTELNKQGKKTLNKYTIEMLYYNIINTQMF